MTRAAVLTKNSKGLTDAPYVITSHERRWFKVMNGLPYAQLDFDVVARYRARIEDNHGQTLEMLHARGGLDFYELWCGMHDKPLFPEQKRAPELMRDDVLLIIIDGAR